MTGPHQPLADSSGRGCGMTGPLEASAVSTFAGMPALRDVSPAPQAAGIGGGGLAIREGAVA